MKILIVGGGVAGPSFAGFLKGVGHDITLIDQAPQWGDIGYAIALWGNGRKMLRLLGVEHVVEKEAYEMPWNVLEDEEGDVLKQFAFTIFCRYGPTIIVTRTSLHHALISTMEDSVKVRFGTTVNTIQTDDASTEGAGVVFSDGTHEHFDLVVGADGIHSKVRDLVFGGGFLKQYGWHVWAFWTPSGLSSPRGAVEVADGGRIFISYPMQDRAVVMFAAALKSGSGATEPPRGVTGLRRHFDDFKESVHRVIEAVPPSEHLFEDNLAHVDMQEWYRGRVVLMGDAQHATSPITGMGASMAMEDAFVLADELKKNDSVEVALAGYARRRHARIQRFRKASDVVEKWLMVKSPLWAMLRDIIIQIVPEKYFTGGIERLLQEKI